MTGHRLIRRLEAERLEKPATTSKTPRNAQTSLAVGLPGAPFDLVVCNPPYLPDTESTWDKAE